MELVQMIHGMTVVEFDSLVANKYRGKIDNALNRGIEFGLSIVEFRQLLTRKKCAYTGINLTLHKNGNPDKTDLTIERIDDSKGYVKGNCIAVCYAANNIKSVFEDPNTLLGVDDAIRMFSVIAALKKKMK